MAMRTVRTLQVLLQEVARCTLHEDIQKMFNMMCTSGFSDCFNKVSVSVFVNGETKTQSLYDAVTQPNSLLFYHIYSAKIDDYIEKEAQQFLYDVERFKKLEEKQKERVLQYGKDISGIGVSHE
jgi:hypothetical protein